MAKSHATLFTPPQHEVRFKKTAETFEIIANCVPITSIASFARLAGIAFLARNAVNACIDSSAGIDAIAGNAWNACNNSFARTACNVAITSFA